MCASSSNSNNNYNSSSSFAFVDVAVAVAVALKQSLQQPITAATTMIITITTYCLKHRDLHG